MCRWKCVSLCIFLFINTISSKNLCNLSGQILTCSTVREDELYGNISVILSNKNINEIEELSILNTSLPILKKDIISIYKHLQTLTIRGVDLSYIEEDAFSDLNNLTSLYLTDNYLEEFNSDSFSATNILRTLDLSQNLLNDLSSFNISLFPTLTLMNISQNRLEYLPESLIRKLEDNSTFYLIVDNNPWNCSHPRWEQYLKPVLIGAFCTNMTYDPSGIEKKLERLASPTLPFQNITVNKNADEIFYKICTLSCSMRHCVYWIVGALWIGIIVGNLCKIKKLLFTTHRTFEDKNTQYDKLDTVYSKA